MNYNSVQEIIDAGTINMTAIRNNAYNDGTWDIVPGADWLSFNGNIVSNIYVSGNSEFGFNSSNRHFAVNNQDTSSYYVYREEGTLYNYYRFLKIRWSGYSWWNQPYTNYLQEYDVILWDTGNISLHMVDVPETNWSGTFTMLGVSYTKPTVTAPDITFWIQEDGTLVPTSELIDITAPYDRKFLVQSGDMMYTTLNGILEELGNTVTAELFRDYGTDEPPASELLITLVNPVILYWIDTSDTNQLQHIVAVETAVPPAQTFESPDYFMTDSTVLGIEKAVAVATETVQFAVSFDSGLTWKTFIGGVWAELSENASGMSAATLNAITTESWNSMVVDGKFRFRISLMDETSEFTSLIIDYLNEVESSTESTE